MSSDFSLNFLQNIPRPVHHSLNGSTQPIAASGLESYDNLVQPLCPHAMNGFRMGCEMHVWRKTEHFTLSHGLQVDSWWSPTGVFIDSSETPCEVHIGPTQYGNFSNIHVCICFLNLSFDMNSMVMPVSSLD